MVFLFCYSFFLLLTSLNFFPAFNFTPFAPLLVISCLSRSRGYTVLLGFFLGLVLDGLVHDFPFGFFALCFALTSLVLCYYRLYFSSMFISACLLLLLAITALDLIINSGLFILGRLTLTQFFMELPRLVLSGALDALAGAFFFFIPGWIYSFLSRYVRLILIRRKSKQRRFLKKRKTFS